MTNNHIQKPIKNYDVTCFQVVHRNKIAFNFPLSELFETEVQVRTVLSEIQKTHPGAIISGQMFLFSSENAEGRQDLLSSIEEG